MYLNVRYIITNIICLNVIIFVDSYRILGVFPFASKSHYFLQSNLMKGLAEAGHDVTFITPFSEKNVYNSTNGKWREIYLENHLDIVKGLQKTMNLNSRLATDKFKMFLMFFKMFKYNSDYADKTLSDPKVQQLIHSGEKFDVVIVTDFMLDSLKVLAYHFEGHLVMFSNNGVMSFYNTYIGVPTLPSFYPDLLAGTPPKKNFIQRLKSTFAKLLLDANFYFLGDPAHEAVIKKHFPNAPSLYDISYNTSLALINGHSSINYVSLRVPIMVDIGGFHVQPPTPLPLELKKILDEAKHGVIYFSLGSHLKSDDLLPETIQAILNVFSRRKETVLWKWEQTTLPGKPNNVIISKWFPQQDILAHPNIKLFVTHGGFLSTTETIYHGVPVLALPIMGDQKQNAVTAAYLGFGRYIFIEDITEERFEKELKEVLSNSKYREVVKERSKILHDRRHKPIDDAVYWIEYVVRHKGAKHLRIPYADMPWYQYFLLDVISLVVGIILILSVLVTKTVRFIVGKFKKDKQKIKKS